MSSLQLQNVERAYGSYRVLHGIDLDVAAGEFVVMVGPSGCGKSTLLKTIAGLDRVTAGRILIGGRDVTDLEPSQRGIAMVFQSYALYPHMTVGENMGFGLRMAGRPRDEIAAAVARAARILHITDQLDKRPRQLSGGQRQRVAIGRAITRSPEIFLFDEPLSNLDAALRTRMRVELSGLHAELGATMVYVTHDQVEAMTMATRIVVLDRGRVMQVGSPLELYHNPANLFVATFLGAPRMNVVEVEVDRSGPGSVSVRVPSLPPIELPVSEGLVVPEGTSLRLGLRPEVLRLTGQEEGTASRNVIPGAVRLAEQLGRETVLHVDASPVRCADSDSGTGDLTVQTGRVVGLGTGERVCIRFDPADAYLFSAQDGRCLSPQRPSLR